MQVDYPGAGPLLLGGLASQPSYPYAGRLDEVRVWNVARNGTEIAGDMNHSLSGTEPNLAAYWNFNEGRGITVQDATSHGHTGTILGDPEWMRTTPGGHALSFSNVNQYASATIPVLASNYTFSAWVFLRAGGSSSSFPVGVLSAAHCGDSVELLIHSLAGGSTTHPQYFQLGRCGSFSGSLSDTRVPTNQWVHLAATVSTNKEVAYYIDGVAAGAWDGSAYNLTLGPTITLADNTVRRFNGLLDEIQIWNVARTQADIVQDFVRSLNQGDPNLVAYFRFDEGTDTKAHNLGVDPRPAMLVNDPAFIWLTPTLPYPATLPASGVSISSAVLHGLVNPNGLETASWFDWGATTSYEN
ncbi:MAG TPA: LamG domain-containing protein, partial [Verrucomicrobiae bacterium]|nr:LamG domain-containing protein [Verrucomicrobiae bacterium]